MCALEQGALLPASPLHTSKWETAKVIQLVLKMKWHYCWQKTSNQLQKKKCQIWRDAIIIWRVLGTINKCNMTIIRVNWLPKKCQNFQMSEKQRAKTKSRWKRGSSGQRRSLKQEVVKEVHTCIIPQTCVSPQVSLLLLCSWGIVGAGGVQQRIVSDDWSLYSYLRM